jgi:hypothetical protein
LKHQSTTALQSSQKTNPATDFFQPNGSDWQFLATGTVPNYTDSFQLLASGESAVWKYKSIYRKDDEHAGTWSDDVSITVSGM